METPRHIPKGNLWLLIAGFTLLSSLPFLVPRLGFLSLIAFVPLFQLDRLLTEYRVKHAFWYYYTAFLLFNIAATFWIWFVSPAGAIAAILLNALQMAAIFALYRWGGRIIRRKNLRPVRAEALSLLWFIVTWLAWEHIYFNIEISWPWLCLGNSFATNPEMVQWYDHLGAVGGSAWILLCNGLIYLAIISREKADRRWYVASAAAAVILPILCSEIRYASYRETEDPMEVVVIQPNIDPFHKYGVEPQSALDARLIELMAREVTPQTRYIITPETFTYDLDIDNPDKSPSYQKYRAFLAAHPETDLLLGALTYRHFECAAKPTRSARPRGQGHWIDVYNTAMVMDSHQIYGSYVKSKLVPGVEIIPYENVLKFLGPIVAKFGGSSSSYGTQDEMEAIPCSDGRKLGAMICYESVYGDWSRVATKKGARFLAVMTNDGWWGDTPGYRQHFNFARLRAIENRRDVVQAANTGTSGLINQRGDVLAKTGWWVETTLKGTINGNDALTPFVRHGDRVGRCAGYLFLAALLTLLVFAVSDRRSGRDKSASGRS
ncbi:MAG: apolipoprotein N-acyltransferase [Bacteroidales bacterium]|nr:apolipoprotein N-acyltransferase [Bacteroidales bacterium]